MTIRSARPPATYSGIGAAESGETKFNVRTKTILPGVIAAFVALAAISADASEYRSYRAKRDFRMENPCPSTGKVRGACPEYVVDHVVPLCAGGADAPSNMQWQTVEAGKRKDRDERKACRHLKGQGTAP